MKPPLCVPSVEKDLNLQLQETIINVLLIKNHFSYHISILALKYFQVVFNFSYLVFNKTTLKSLRLRKLLDHSAFAYWVLLGPSGFLRVLLGPSGSWVLSLLIFATWP